MTTKRYLPPSALHPFLDGLPDTVSKRILGKSLNTLPVQLLTLGQGSCKILMWSQMHGNESTSTRALLDFIPWFLSKAQKQYQKTFTLSIILQLNPDGANAYTRLNAAGVDLNRDAKELTQSESRVLRTTFEIFKPHFCFNMHGQRTIFSAGNTPNSSILSFLSPSENKERSLTVTRQKAMEIIQVMNKTLQPYLTNQIGRYDDGFNDNCVGDYFQSHGTPTVLFEAGHYPDDYQREVTRKYMALALICAVDYASHNSVEGTSYPPYFDIPENDKKFYDVIIRNALLNPSYPKSFKDIGILYTEVLVSGEIIFKPKIALIGNLDRNFGHKEIDAEFKLVSHPNFELLSVGNEIDFIMIENTKNLLFVNNNLI